MNRKISAVFAMAMALVLVIGAVAWACTPQTVITQLRPLSGPAGTALSIAGSTSTPVEIRWNSTDGPPLAAVSGPQFAVKAAIPVDAAPGVYYLLSNGRALETFQVTDSGGGVSLAEGDLWSGLATGANATGLEDAPGASSGSALRTGGLALLALGILGMAGGVSVMVSPKIAKARTSGTKGN